MAKETIMRMAAEEAYQLLQAAMDKIMSAEHFPEQASREAINKQLREAGDLLCKANNWVYAIKST
ncbi:hypothetical protein KI809_10600 [Geobacter pelophilus]|uniref:Uncharacterized protein n=1 Tax=Geoanaerobacter pelophilus TaxID=60036 RepID=A0AAW4L9N6_9BACT|nr:hypothetical protein [Geoanaerobacter pelophilus]MBT0664749.1 hypothetical protein [Geoanaerobacter pelophilus]